MLFMTKSPNQSIDINFPIESKFLLSIDTYESHLKIPQNYFTISTGSLGTSYLC